MNQLRHTLTLYAILLAIAPAATTAGDAKQIAWGNQLAPALEQAKESGRMVWLEFFRPGCGWCKTLEKNVHADPDFIQAVNRSFIPVKVRGIPKPLKERYSARGTPHTLMLAPDGTAIHRQRGYIPPGDFLLVLRAAQRRNQNYKADPEAWHDMPQADLLWANRKYKQAAELYQKALDANPQNLDALLRVAWQDRWYGDAEAALDTFQRVLEIDPDEGSARYALASQKLQDGKLSQAAKGFADLLDVPGWYGDKAAQGLWVVAQLKGKAAARDTADKLLRQRLDLRQPKDHWQHRYLNYWMRGVVKTESMVERTANTRRKWFRADFHFLRGVKSLAEQNIKAAQADFKVVISQTARSENARTAQALLRRTGAEPQAQ